MNVTRIGIDLAKQIFQIYGFDKHEVIALRKQLRRSQMLSFFEKLTTCLVGMEACSSSHYWSRELQQLGHQVRLIVPQYVKPYVKGNKNDAEAICEAVGRPSMRFVSVKTVALNRICKQSIGYAANWSSNERLRAIRSGVCLQNMELYTNLACAYYAHFTPPVVACSIYYQWVAYNYTRFHWNFYHSLHEL